MEVKIKRLSENAILPNKAHEGDAGFDLYANISAPVTLYPHKTHLIPTGFCWEIPEGYFGGIYARSGLATKEGLRPANCVGVIDSSYRGEVMVAIHNDNTKTQTLMPNQKIAQLVIQPIPQIDLVVVEELNTTDRNSSGFGSTGS